MADQKKTTDAKSSPGGKRRPSKTAGPLDAKGDPDRRREDEGDVHQGLDERAIVRKNAKPRSARQSMKGPNNRKG